ncbi:MAG: hypothetical protein AAFZ92_01845, partial [Pseudomonadota bacterium]
HAHATEKSNIIQNLPLKCRMNNVKTYGGLSIYVTKHPAPLAAGKCPVFKTENSLQSKVKTP